MIGRASPRRQGCNARSGKCAGSFVEVVGATKLPWPFQRFSGGSDHPSRYPLQSLVKARREVFLTKDERSQAVKNFCALLVCTHTPGTGEGVVNDHDYVGIR